MDAVPDDEAERRLRRQRKKEEFIARVQAQGGNVEEALARLKREHRERRKQVQQQQQQPQQQQIGDEDDDVDGTAPPPAPAAQPSRSQQRMMPVAPPQHPQQPAQAQAQARASAHAAARAQRTQEVDEDIDEQVDEVVDDVDERGKPASVLRPGSSGAAGARVPGGAQVMRPAGAAASGLQPLGGGSAAPRRGMTMMARIDGDAPVAAPGALHAGSGAPARNAMLIMGPSGPVAPPAALGARGGPRGVHGAAAPGIGARGAPAGARGGLAGTRGAPIDQTPEEDIAEVVDEVDVMGEPPVDDDVSISVRASATSFARPAASLRPSSAVGVPSATAGGVGVQGVGGAASGAVGVATAGTAQVVGTRAQPPGASRVGGGSAAARGAAPAVAANDTIAMLIAATRAENERVVQQAASGGAVPALPPGAALPSKRPPSGVPVSSAGMAAFASAPPPPAAAPGASESSAVAAGATVAGIRGPMRAGAAAPVGPMRAAPPAVPSLDARAASGQPAAANEAAAPAVTVVPGSGAPVGGAAAPELPPLSTTTSSATGPAGTSAGVAGQTPVVEAPGSQGSLTSRGVPAGAAATHTIAVPVAASAPPPSLVKATSTRRVRPISEGEHQPVPRMSIATIQTRAQRRRDLARLVELDERSFEVFETPPLSSYKLFIKQYGRAGRDQASVQVPERAEIECQTTPGVHASNQSQQAPDDMEADALQAPGGRSGGGALTAASAAALQRFVRASAQVLAGLWSASMDASERVPHAAAAAVAARTHGAEAAECTMTGKLMSGRPVLAAVVSPPMGRLAAVAYGPSRAAGVLSAQHVLCVWDTVDVRKPMRVLVCGSDRVDHVAASCDSDRWLVGGSAEGSLVAWDLWQLNTVPVDALVADERVEAQAAGEASLHVGVASASTDCAADNPHVAPIVSVHLLASGGAAQPDDSVVHGVAVDSAGVVSLFIVRAGDEAGAGTESVGGAASAGVSMTITASLRIADQMALELRHLSDVVQLTAACPCPSNSNEVFVASTTGHVMRMSRFGRPSAPRTFARPLSTSAATCIDFCAFVPTLFLVGYGDGTVALYSTTSGTPQATWRTQSDDAVRAVCWSSHDACVFFVLDARGTVSTYDLQRDQQSAVAVRHASQSSSRVVRIRPSPATWPRRLLCARDDGAVDVLAVDASASSSAMQPADAAARLDVREWAACVAP